MRITFPAVIALVLFISSVPVHGQAPTMTCETSEHVVLIVAPNGEGTPLTEAYIYGTNTLVDATLHVLVPGSFVCFYPRCSVSLESTSGSIIFCEGYNCADSDVAGHTTTFSGPLYAGGHSDSGEMIQLSVTCNSNPPETAASPPVPITIISPDLDGNLVVNLSDIVLFVPMYYGAGYRIEIDYSYDGVINLSDVIVFAGFLNTGCP